ncbi:sphinganine C4-monooxygenase 2-like [Wolffia australiana]
MASEMMEELMPAFVPIAVYWITSGLYHVLINSKDEYRLFPKGTEDAQNLATPRQVLKQVLANQSMQMGLAIFQFMFLRKLTGSGLSKEPASYLKITWQFAVAMLVLDAWEYFWHRWTHENQFLFKHFHAVHHHLIVPYCYGGQHLHLVDAFVGQLLGSFVSLIITGMSPRTATVFFSVLAVKVVDDHCSRWFPNCNPFHKYLSNNTAFHGVHHQLQGSKYNYSIHFLVTWDLLLGTYLPFTVEERKGGGYEIVTAKDD